MATSDSERSIDWLTGEEDVCNSSETLSLQRGEETPSSSSSSSPSSSPSCTDCPFNWFQCEAQRKNRGDEVLRQADSDSVGPDQEAELRPIRKRTAADDANTENKLISLKRYVQPLASILRGLKSGRYSDRLSGFQESLAIDRIQRIMGVLQNPNTGGNLLSILLKIQEMLQSWFPHIKANVAETDGGSPAKRIKEYHRSRPPSPSASTCSLEVTQDSAVSSSTDFKPPQRHLGPPQHHWGPPPYTISSPCLERLLQAPDSIIAVSPEARRRPVDDPGPVLAETGSHHRTGRL